MWPGFPVRRRRRREPEGSRLRNGDRNKSLDGLSEARGVLGPHARRIEASLHDHQLTPEKPSRPRTPRRWQGRSRLRSSGRGRSEIDVRRGRIVEPGAGPANRVRAAAGTAPRFGSVGTPVRVDSPGVGGWISDPSTQDHNRDRPPIRPRERRRAECYPALAAELNRIALLLAQTSTQKPFVLS